MTDDLAEVHPSARQGSYCPKLCHHACPVLAATGREADGPWGLHVTVEALASGRFSPDADTYPMLHGCTGCHACREACLLRQDVPAQVRAGRAAVVAGGHAPEGVRTVATHLAGGRSPWGSALPELPVSSASPTVTVLVGCTDDVEIVTAIDQLLRSAGQEPAYVRPSACCGSLLDDLGLSTDAVWARAALGAGFTGPTTVTVTDPHCLGSARAALTGVEVVDVGTFLYRLVTDGRLPAGRAGRTVLHEACVPLRDEPDVASSARSLVQGPAIAGCSGAGLGFDLLAPGPAQAVAGRTAAVLGSDREVVSPCARAQRRLAAAGVPAVHLAVHLAGRLEGRGG